MKRLARAELHRASEALVLQEFAEECNRALLGCYWPDANGVWSNVYVRIQLLTADYVQLAESTQTLYLQQCPVCHCPKGTT